MFEEYLSLSRPQAIRFVENLCNEYRKLIIEALKANAKLINVYEENRELKIELTKAQTVNEQNQQLIKAQSLALSRAKLY